MDRKETASTQEPDSGRRVFGQFEVDDAVLPDIGLPRIDLPRELTSFVGRQHEIREVAHRLQGGRLLTLIGAGGIGKTRLALEVAERCRSDFADGARFVNLAPIGDAGIVAHAIIRALGLRQQRDRPPLETLCHRLQTQKLLLVLDNCEHLLSGCAIVADALLRACPGLRILATSREPLGVDGEAVWAVPTLGLLDRRRDVSVDGLLVSEAGRLVCGTGDGCPVEFFASRGQRPRGCRDSLAARWHSAGDRIGRCPRTRLDRRANRLTPRRSAQTFVEGLTCQSAAAPDSACGNRLELPDVVGGRKAAVQLPFSVCWRLDPAGRRGGLLRSVYKRKTLSTC